MGLFDKISNLIFEEESDSNIKKEKKGNWTDIFFENDSVENTKKDPTQKKKKSFLDIFFEENPDDDIKSTFVEEENTEVSVLDDIASQIQRRESELINLAAFFKTVNPTDYPDSSAEYEAYLSLVKQLNSIKDLSITSKNSTINSMNNYQLQGNFRKFELDYAAHINAIKSLCYLSEITTLNDEMKELFSTNFTNQTQIKIKQTEGYITLISKNSNIFDKKYSARLYKQLIKAEYRLTLLKLMNELKNGENPRRNPFASFSSQKKETFQTYISKDIRDSSDKYNLIADNKEKYTKYNLIKTEIFDQMDSDAEIISGKINKYTIDDFLLNELLEDGDGFETLKKFLIFKLNLNYIDNKTEEAEKRFLDDNYNKVTSSNRVRPQKRGSYTKDDLSKFPDYDDNF